LYHKKGGSFFLYMSKYRLHNSILKTKNLTEHIFYLTDLNLLEVYGVNDNRLSMIQAGYPDVKIIARGDELKISGEEPRIDKLKNILGYLFDEIRRKGSITENRFSEILTPEHKVVENGSSQDKEVLLFGSGGGVIKPKTSGQKLIIEAANRYDVVFAVGPAGTGKTYMAVAMAVKALKEKRVKKIILSRPAVDAGESLGFLPGDMKEKVDPYLRPMYDALEDMIHAEKLKFYLQQNVIEVAPLAFMRGRTLSNAFIILDEAQNTTEMQMRMFLTRLGENSKMIITGDETQIDLPHRVRSGLIQATRLFANVKGIGIVYLKGSDVVRHKIVKEILTAYELEDKERGGY
jgi:phosphate starvation-inducible PhoH-like protein